VESREVPSPVDVPSGFDADGRSDTHPGIVFDPEIQAFLTRYREASAMSREASAMSRTASEEDGDLPNDGPYPNEYRPERDYRSSPNAIGAGFLVLVARELTGTTQRQLAQRVGTSQPTLARIETGNRTPTVRTLLRVARAAGFEIVLGLRRSDARLPPQPTLDAFALIGTLHLNDEDGLADFVVYREPSPLEGPKDMAAGPSAGA
jgi:transcriptional regulator with XRE-family HTH domain